MIPWLELGISGLRPRLHVAPCRLIPTPHVRPYDLTESDRSRTQLYPLNEQETHRISYLCMIKSSCSTCSMGHMDTETTARAGMNRLIEQTSTNTGLALALHARGTFIGTQCELRLSFDFTIWRATYSKAFTELLPHWQNKIINRILDLGAPQSEVKWRLLRYQGCHAFTRPARMLETQGPLLR